MTALCEEYGVSRKTGYKWLARFRAQGPAGLAEFTNLIRNSMGQTPCHGISAPPAVTVVICYPCCRYILLPMLPVRTSAISPPDQGEVRWGWLSAVHRSRAARISLM